jgi:Gpi18-like mannosyltransferase
LLAAAMFAISPGSIVIASFWDQWDAISTLAALVACWCFFSRRYELATAALVYAALIKPQFALLGLLFAVFYLRELIGPGFSRVSSQRTLISGVTRAITSAVTAWVTALAIILPFNVGLWPVDAFFTLRQRVNFAFIIHDETTLNAFNLWATPIAGNAINDWDVTFIGLSSRTWGQILFGAAILVIVGVLWKLGTTEALIWAAAALSFAWFMLPTRVHERYMFPVVVFAVLLAAIRPRYLWLAAITTLTFGANIAGVYHIAHDMQGAPFFDRYDPWMIAASCVNLAAFLFLMVEGVRDALDPARRSADPVGWRGLIPQFR